MASIDTFQEGRQGGRDHAPVVVSQGSGEPALQPLPSADREDTFNLYRFVDIRRGTQQSIHLLGWRMRLRQAWLTDPLTVVDMERGIVRTVSGRTFGLRGKDLEPPTPALQECLARHLAEWSRDVGPRR